MLGLKFTNHINFQSFEVVFRGSKHNFCIAYFNHDNAGIDFRRQNLTYVDAR